MKPFISNLFPGRGPLYAALLGSCVIACGGTYSNEDIAFQSAVPASESLQPNVGAQLVEGSAEYYRLTHGVVTGYRKILGFVAVILGEVRRVPATTRAPGQRIWGPFADEEDPRFVHRVVMRKLPAGTDATTAPDERFTYSIETAPGGTPAVSDAWAQVVTGWFDPARGVSQGRGQVIFDVDSLRTRRYRLGADVETLRVITLDYDIEADARTLIVHQENLASASSRSADLAYRETADGAATTRFTVTGTGAAAVEAFDVVSAWRADGAGRADVLVSRGASLGLSATDCWDGLTQPTYVRRDWDAGKNTGDPSACVLPALR